MLNKCKAFSIVGFVAQVYAVKLGVGHHAPALKLTNMGAILEWRFYAGLLVVAGVSLVKISVGLALLRLFQRKAHRIFLWVTIAFLVVFTTASLGTLIFQCIPVRAAWDLTLREKPSTRCWTMDIFRDIGVFNSCTFHKTSILTVLTGLAINIATDILFACMPIPLIWKLQMNTRTKVTLICVLGLGFLCVPLTCNLAKAVLTVLSASAAAVVKSVYQYNFFTTLDWSFHDNFNVFALLVILVWCLGAKKTANIGKALNLMPASLPRRCHRSSLSSTGSKRPHERLPRVGPPTHAHTMALRSHTFDLIRKR